MTFNVDLSTVTKMLKLFYYMYTLDNWLQGMYRCLFFAGVNHVVDISRRAVIYTSTCKKCMLSLPPTGALSAALC